MKLYQSIISESTGVTNEKTLAELEDIMRHDIFHSTLDWKTRAQLGKAAKTALQIKMELDSPKMQPIETKPGASHLNKAEAATAATLPQTQQGKEESVSESAVEAFDQLEAREEESI